MKVYLGRGHWIRQNVWNLTAGINDSRYVRCAVKAIFGDRNFIRKTFLPQRCSVQYPEGPRELISREEESHIKS